ncbi:hypothetical protein LOK49_LG11G01334 [Camellia lanceoleosa]|uniref:Uncharacterized protein n=1 Tax=Camellia lanceoleosa TaxID=1840588 RepID=A0ACC0G3U1_9ERIC|nr:hypothetical protein LOK49_LG11G01334 [Camellia lanceoleosa]
MSKLFYSDKKGVEEKIWRKTIDFIIKVFEKLKPEDFTRITMQYGGATNSYPCSILRRCYKMKTIKYCNKLNELGNSLFHRDDFFIMEGKGKVKEIFYVSPLLQKLTRELLMATKEINDHAIPLFQICQASTCTSEEGGTISIKVSLLQCRPKPLIETELSIRSSENLKIQWARSKKWWKDLNELFAHSFFWSSGQHESVLMSVHIHMQRPQASKPPNILMGGLDLLADELKIEWDKQHKHWNGPWTAAFQKTMELQERSIHPFYESNTESKCGSL